MKTTVFNSKASLEDTQTYANSLRYGLKITRGLFTHYRNFTHRLLKHFHQRLDLRFKKIFSFSFFIWDDSIECCEANFHFKTVVHIYAKSRRYNENIKATA